MSEPTPKTGDPNITASPPPPAAPTAVTATPPKPAAPPKPAPAKSAKPDAGRRAAVIGLLTSPFAIAWATLGAALFGMTLGTVRFLFPNVLAEPPNKFKVGFADSYEPEKVVERYKDQNAWIVRHKDEKHGDIIYALSTTCTHLGCTPNWLESAAKFKCPCHGSGFYISGVNFEGPAPRPLERWAIGIGDDGQIVVDKSKKFQRELGQWDNADSFIKV